MKMSPAPTATTSLSTPATTPDATAGSARRSNRGSVARAGLVAAAGLCLAATLGVASAAFSAAGPSHSTSVTTAGQASGVVVAGGFEWGSNRSR